MLRLRLCVARQHDTRSAAGSHARYLAIAWALFLVFWGVAVIGTTGLILWFNVGNLWHLVTHTSEGPIAVIMLIVFGTITFGSAQIGYKIMTMKEEDEDDEGGKRDEVAVDLAEAIPFAAPSIDHR